MAELPPSAAASASDEASRPFEITIRNVAMTLLSVAIVIVLLQSMQSVLLPLC
jgi:hypothetical protein